MGYALIVAATHGHEDVVRVLLDTPNKGDWKSSIVLRKALLKAVEYGHENIVRLCHAQGVAADKKPSYAQLNRATHIWYMYLVSWVG